MAESTAWVAEYI